mmetsp:Transcript_28471/g.82033  ORF Transcript_28471/g.82033 Transcript_28471/m.82033 type:complete len:83 (+) Transcript_28471:740-988(+)
MSAHHAVSPRDPSPSLTPTTQIVHHRYISINKQPAAAVIHQHVHQLRMEPLALVLNTVAASSSSSSSLAGGRECECGPPCRP